jgi:hypothetical protein
VARWRASSKLIIRSSHATQDDWDGPGTYFVSPDGYEDAQAFLVTVGAKEALIDGDTDYVVLGDPLILVDKLTGTVSFLSELDHERIDNMTPVSV